jgi:hypothetical protein
MEAGMKKIFAVLIAAAISGGAFAAGGDASEGGVPTAPLKIYSGGFAGGAMYSLNDEFTASIGGDVVGKLTIMNSWEFVPDVALFGDVNWYIGDVGLLNFGLDLGCDYYLSQSRFKPFVGVGVGAHYFDQEDVDDFGSKFGVSFTGHAGFALEMTETVHVRFRVPYHFVASAKQYHGVGVDVGVMFLSNLRKVRQLHY